MGDRELGDGGEGPVCWELGGLGGSGRAWGGAGETRKSCGEGASSEGHPLPSFPGVGAPHRGTERCGLEIPGVPGVGINGAWPPPSSSWSRLPLRPEHRPSLPFGRCWTGTLASNTKWKTRRSPYSQNLDARTPSVRHAYNPPLATFSSSWLSTVPIGAQDVKTETLISWHDLRASSFQQDTRSHSLVYGAAVLTSGEAKKELTKSHPEIPRILPNLPRPSMQPTPASVS